LVKIKKSPFKDHMSHFNSQANHWDSPEKITQNKAYSELIKKHLPIHSGLKILEVGCGTGLLGGQFLDQKNLLLGIDTSEGMLKVFSEKFSNNPRVSSKLLNLEDEELNNEKFDLIISSMAFHHLKNPASMLLKLSRYLNPQGIIAIIDLDQEDGSFHPDPKNMGVHHFGFNESQTLDWCKMAKLTKMPREIAHIIHKNNKEYPLFLELFKH
jgi:2-polyprenyl-3-methyl-5-hydroxy-6-metoxy-1,4-benzoquinol methylase